MTQAKHNETAVRIPVATREVQIMIQKPGTRFPGWKMVLLAFLAQNCAMGFAFGSFGPLLASSEQHFGVTRAVVATGMSALMLALGLLSPIVGSALQRVSIRSVLIGGAVISAAGYIGLALSTSFVVAIAMFMLVGAGVCLLGIIAPLTLVARWFVTARAKALSFVNLPILLFVTPYLIAELLPQFGRTTILLCIGAIFIILIPLLGLVVDAPEKVQQKPWGYRTSGENSDPARSKSTQSLLSTRDIISSSAFWIVSLGMGIMAGAGSAYVVHIIPFGVEQQMSLQLASVLLSVYAGSGIVGTLFVGWFADRVGPPLALVAMAFSQAVLWWGLLHVAGPSLYLLAAFMGICGVPLTTVHGAAIGTLFGAENISRVMGFSYLIKLPFLFSFAPLIGLLFDQTGDYRLPFLLTSVSLFVVWGAFLLLVYMVRPNAQVLRAPG